MTQIHPNAKLALLLCSVLAFAFISLAGAEAAAAASLTTASASEGGVVSLSGSGFDASETVYIALVNKTSNSVVYNFTETPTTDNVGNFTADLTLPKNVYGTFNLTAHTSTITTYSEYSISKAETAITVTPDDSNIITVNGTGFNSSATVTLKLADTTQTVYTFQDSIKTDADGNFSATVIIPTSISGNYTLTATTSTATANATLTVPDLTGPTGATGAAGAIGKTGETGATGESADTTIAYVAITISIIAIAISAITILLKH